MPTSYQTSVSTPALAPLSAASTTSTAAPPAVDPADPAAHEGWQALAAASLGRLLTGTELAAVEHLPTELALDLLFPGLSDPARHEALSALH